MTDLEAFHRKFRVEELMIFANDHWSASVRPSQPTLGCMIVSSRNEAQLLADLSSSGAASLVDALGVVQARLMDVFQCEKVNILMLMHFDIHLHFHIIPRYKADQEYAGVFWTDDGWPGFPTGMGPGESEVSDATLKTIQQALT